MLVPEPASVEIAEGYRQLGEVALKHMLGQTLICGRREDGSLLWSLSRLVRSYCAPSTYASISALARGASDDGWWQDMAHEGQYVRELAGCPVKFNALTTGAVARPLRAALVLEKLLQASATFGSCVAGSYALFEHLCAKEGRPTWR